MALQKIAQEKNNLANKMQVEKLNSTKFKTKVSLFWLNCMLKCLGVVAPLSIKESLADFRESILALDAYYTNGLTLYQFKLIQNALEAVSMHQLGLNEREYCQLIDESLKYIADFSTEINELRDTIILQVEAEFRQKTEALAKLAKDENNGSFKREIGQA